MSTHKKLPSVMKHQFSEVPQAQIPRSSFNRSHGVKTTIQNAGDLVPIYVDEVLPGDTFNLRTSGFARMSTPLYPVMDNLYLDTFYFAVPMRLVWTNFVKMMGEQENPADSVDYTVPTATAPVGGYANGSLQDHMGIPTKIASLVHSNLPMRAYNLIWNEWFRDENLQDSIVVDKDDGPDTVTDYVIKKRGKRHDYFTSCLPWPQKGTAVDLPLGSSAPVIGIGKHDQTYALANQSVYETDGTATTTYSSTSKMDGDATSTRWYVEEDPNNSGFPNIRADLSNATAATINQLREAFQIQRMYEKDARGGTRYVEQIKSHFGVTSPDFRLQRPEYLGGGSTPILSHAVAANAETTGASTGDNTNLGDVGAFVTAAFDGHGFTKSFTEHCIVIGLANVRADLTYQQGLNRMWSREDRLDFYWPSLAQIGEQAVLNKEIYANADANDDLVFGYQERYAEYRYKPSTVHGQFRSNDTTPLDAWHLSQNFSSLPVLGDTFIQDNPPMDRVIIATDEPDFIADFYHQLICARPMPLFGVPSGIGKF